MKQMKYKTQLICSLVAASIVSVPSYAQQKSDVQVNKQAEGEQLSTVVVTAQKRKEDPLKLALSVSAITGTDLAAQHITDITDLTRAIPNISFSAGDGPGAGMSDIQIRGVSSSAGTATVAIYMDDVSMTVSKIGAGASEPKLFDIDRIEVLRGPQGTLYGSSSMGGTIKFISNQPDLKQREVNVYGEVSSTKGGGINYSSNVVANLPIVNNELGLRIGAQKGRTGGYIKHVNADGATITNNINSSDDEALRVALLWKPNADLSVTPAVFYQKVFSHDVDAYNPSLPGFATSKLMREPGTDRLLIPSLTINYNLEFADLTVVSSLFQRKFNYSRDASYYNSQFLAGFVNDNAPAGLADAIYALPSTSDSTNYVNQVSHEVRLASKPYQVSGPALTWVAGLYSANYLAKTSENDPVYGLNNTFKNYGVSPTDDSILSGALPIGFPNDNTYFGSRRLNDQQGSVFGELNYHFTPSLHATGGLRYLKARNTIDRRSDLFFANGAIKSSGKDSTSATTPKFALTWELDSSNTVYASAAKGFRLGGSNGTIPTSVCTASGDLQRLGLTEAPTRYNSDSLWSYEIGNKSRLFGNRLSINASAFYLRWNDIQQDVSLPGCGFGFATNVGSATSKGIEIEIKGKPMAGLLLGLSGGYTNATLSDSSGLQKGGIIGAVAGAQIQGVPKFNAAFTSQYNFSALDGRSAFVRGAIRWVGTSRGSLDPENTDYLRSAYHTLDAGAGISFESAEVSFFIKNLLDEKRAIQHPSVANVSYAYRLVPRTIGMTVSTSF